MNQAAKFDPIAVLGHLKRSNCSNFADVAQRNPEIINQWSFFFFKYLKISQNQQLRFDHMSVLGLLNR